MWKRLAQERLVVLWEQFPAVLILGARQVGKTTLALQTFPKLPYCDLEEPNLRQLFTDDPTFLLKRHNPSLALRAPVSVERQAHRFTKKARVL